MISAVLGQKEETETRIEVWDVTSGHQVANWKNTSEAVIKVHRVNLDFVWDGPGLAFATKLTAALLSQP
jgi:hypothetical protein